MGLDISVNFDNLVELMEFEEFDELFYTSNLSRTFCNFMSRKHVVEDCRPELDQIGKITRVDIHFLYDMEKYSENWEIDDMLEFEKNVEKRKQVKENMLQQNEEIENNISIVIIKLTKLIGKLEKIPDLVEQLEKTTYDTLGISTYFSGFNNNSSNGYIDNNLGQDLRNLLNLITFAENNGAKTVYFNYG